MRPGCDDGTTLRKIFYGTLKLEGILKQKRAVEG
jgi:hypothetical protein